MKRIIILFALVGFTGISGIALGQGGFKNMSDEQILEKLETRLDKKVARLTKKLELTPQQIPKVRQALADGQTQSFELRKANIKDRKAKRAQKKAIRQATKTSVASFLTTAQNEKFAKMKKGGKGKKKLRKMAKRLNLDATQKAQMKEIFKGKKKELKALKASGATKVELKAKRKEIRKASMKEFKTILNPAQLEKLKKFKKNRRNKKKNASK